MIYTSTIYWTYQALTSHRINSAWTKRSHPTMEQSTFTTSEDNQPIHLRRNLPCGYRRYLSAGNEIPQQLIKQAFINVCLYTLTILLFSENISIKIIVYLANALAYRQLAKSVSFCYPSLFNHCICSKMSYLYDYPEMFCSVKSPRVRACYWLSQSL